MSDTSTSITLDTASVENFIDGVKTAKDNFMDAHNANTAVTCFQVLTTLGLCGSFPVDYDKEFEDLETQIDSLITESSSYVRLVVTGVRGACALPISSRTTAQSVRLLTTVSCISTSTTIHVSLKMT